MPNDDEKSRAKEQIELWKKEQESFIKQFDSKDVTDTLQVDIRKREKSDEDRIREFDKRFKKRR